ncbi:MAG: serine hydrolase [Bacteroidota bacterium]
MKEYTKTKSGLHYKIIQQGTGEKAMLGDTVSLFETTSYRDGTVLYSNENASAPIQIILGEHMVIQAVEEGLRGMRSGEIKKIIAPPHLVKREIYPKNVSPDSTLVIKLRVQQIQKGSVKTANNTTIKTNDLDMFIQEQMTAKKVPGLSFALISDGEIVYKKSYGFENVETKKRVTNQTIFEAASVSKAVFAYFTMLAKEQNIISLDVPLYKYFSEPLLADERYKKITARMALSHTSGLPNWRFLNEDGKLDIKFTPGTKFHYSGEGYEYVAKVLAHLYKVDYDGLDSIINTKVYQPLNMMHSRFRVTEQQLATKKATGYENGTVSEGIPADLAKPYFGASFKFHTTIDDFSKWMLALLNSQLMKQETQNEMFSEQVILPEEEALRIENGFDSWALGFIRTKTKYGLKLAHGGMNPSFQCYFMILPNTKFGFVFFGNSNSALDILPELEHYLLTGTHQ